MYGVIKKCSHLIGTLALGYVCLNGDHAREPILLAVVSS
jgi:hypothetical protein